MFPVQGYALCALASLIVLLGDYFVKLAVESGHPLTSRPLAAAGLLYALSAVAWYFTFQHMTLAQSGVAVAVFSLLALVGLGVVCFGETLAPRDWLGIGCALASLALMARGA
ncbi:hypothetical protein [Frigidibacter sp. MR17.24]|uniref:hypothetical protein n=1 Tax=Frigidibacter sp. MR17.24 TaxID=3127345 RepID=UPI003012B00D